VTGEHHAWWLFTTLLTRRIDPYDVASLAVKLANHLVWLRNVPMMSAQVFS